MKSWIKNKWLVFAAVAGSILLFFGLVSAVVLGSFFERLVIVHLVIGLLLLLMGLLLSGKGSSGSLELASVVRKASDSLRTSVYLLLLAGVLVCLNWLVQRHDFRFDLTEQAAYSLSPQSVELVAGLKKPLKLVAVDPLKEVETEKLKKLLRLYRYSNRQKVAYLFIDPRRYPERLEKEFGMKAGNRLFMQYGLGPQSGIARLNEVTEESITNALIKLIRGEAQKLYYVQGHDEPSIDSEAPENLKKFAQAVQDQHYQLSSIILAEHAQVPDDAAAVILVSPKKTLLPQEKQMLLRYVEKGGSLLLLHDPLGSPDISELSENFGIRISRNVVLDLMQKLHGAPEIGWQVVARDYGPHPITKGLTATDLTVYLIASALSVDQSEADREEGAQYTELVKSSESAWAETDIASLFAEQPQAGFDQTRDLKGPLALAVAYQKKLKEQEGGRLPAQKSAKVVVFGDSEWIKNVNLHVYANRNLILNAVDWLAGQTGALSIPAAGLRRSFHPVFDNSFKTAMGLSLLLPEFILLFGLFICWRRRTA